MYLFLISLLKLTPLIIVVSIEARILLISFYYKMWFLGQNNEITVAIQSFCFSDTIQ